MVSFWVKRPGLRTIKSKLIPKTNSAVEMVIRRFNQHYQNFGGFDIREAAQLYLAVFEKLYRFTPFSDDTQFVTKITFWQRDRRPPNN